MKTAVIRTDGVMFREAATWVSSVIPGRPQEPWQATVRIEWGDDGLAVSAFDGDTSAIARIESAAVEGGAGAACYSGRRLRDLAGSMRGRDSAELAVGRDGQLDIRYGSASWTVRPFAGDGELPALLRVPEPAGVVDGRLLAAAAAAVIPAAGDAKSPAMFQCVHLVTGGERLGLAATNRYRMHVTSAGWTPGQGARALRLPVTKQALEMAMRAADGDVTIFGSETLVGFSSAGRTVITRLTAGDFTYIAAMAGKVAERPAMSVTAEVPAAELAEAVARVGLFAEPGQPVWCAFDEGEVTLTAGSEDTARESVKCRLTGRGDGPPEPVSIGFAADYLADAVGPVRSADGLVRISMSPPAAQVYVTPSDAEDPYSAMIARHAGHAAAGSAGSVKAA